MFVRSQGRCIVLILTWGSLCRQPEVRTRRDRPSQMRFLAQALHQWKSSFCMAQASPERKVMHDFCMILVVTFCVWFGHILLGVTVEVECFFVSVVQGLGMSQRSYSRCFPSRWRWHSSRRRGWGRCQTIHEFPGVFWNLLESVQVASGSRFLDIPWKGVGWSWHMAQHVQARCHPPWPKRRRLETSLQRMLN